ncbi:MAG: BatD family protein [Flavobacteriales bacterium]
MKRIIQYIILLGLIFFNFTIKGQISFKAILEPKEISVNGIFSVTFQLKVDNGIHEIDDIHYPDFSNFDMIGSSSSTQSNLKNSIISKTFTFRALKKGTFDIGSADIQVEGNLYKTHPLQIKITGTKSSSTQKNQPNQKNTPQGGEILTNKTSKNTKFLVTATNLSPYVGEEILISLRILSKDYNVLHRLRESKLNRFKNFTTTDYPIKKTAIEQENYQGDVYYSRIITQKIIVPQQIGQIAIEPFQLEFPFLIETDQRDFFGRLVSRYVWTKINSNSLIFNVKPLPEANKPENFSGAVGDFNLNVFTDKTRLNAGESVQFDVEVSGKGDFKMVNIPQLSLPSELEIYDPNAYESVVLTQEGHKGKISKSYIVVPQYKGDYEIPVLEFSYFNPKTSEYETKTSPKTVLHIINGSEKPKNDPSKKPTEIANPVNQQKNVQDTLFLQPLKESLTFYNPILSERVIWMIIIGLVIFTTLITGLYPYWKKRKIDIEKKESKALSKQYLIHAKEYLAKQDSLSFYNAIEKALYWFLADRLDINNVDYNTKKISDLLEGRNISREKISQLEEILNLCNYQKYSSSEPTFSMETIYQKTTDFINTFFKK